MKEQGFDLNTSDQEGETPIFKSISGKSYAVTKFLFNNNVDLSKVNIYGVTVEGLIENCDHELLKLFYSKLKSKKLDAKTKSQRSMYKLKNYNFSLDISPQMINTKLDNPHPINDTNALKKSSYFTVKSHFKGRKSKMEIKGLF